MGLSEIVRGFFEGTAYAKRIGESAPLSLTVQEREIANKESECRRLHGESVLNDATAKALAKTWPKDLIAFIYKYMTINTDIVTERTFSRALFFANNDYRCVGECCYEPKPRRF